MNATPREHGEIPHVILKRWKVGDPEGVLGVQMNLSICAYQAGPSVTPTITLPP
jgi:hypothetical protein